MMREIPTLGGLVGNWIQSHTAIPDGDRQGEPFMLTEEQWQAPVFPSATGTELHPSNLANRVLKPAAVEAGLGRWVTADDGRRRPEPWVSFHTFRHTCASLLFDVGKNIKQVQEWLGHADPGFTLRTYVHLMDDGLGGADVLDAAVGSDPEATLVGG